jgi:hypothetical protein
MEINNLDNELNDWGYYIDLESENDNLNKNNQNNKINKCLKNYKFNYLKTYYKEYSDEYTFDTNKLNIKNNTIIFNLKPYYVNKNKIYFVCITSGLVSLSITLLFYYRKLI